MYLTLFSFLLMSFETILKIVSASNIVSVFTSETIHIHHTQSRLCVSTGGLRHAVATLWRSKGGKSGIFASLPKREFVVRGSAGRSLTHVHRHSLGSPRKPRFTACSCPFESLSLFTVFSKNGAEPRF